MVADLSDAFTLQSHLLCRLGERAVLGADAVEALYHLTAAAVELADDLQQFGCRCLILQRVVGLRGVFVRYDVAQAQLVATADGCVDRQWMAALFLRRSLILLYAKGVHDLLL